MSQFDGFGQTFVRILTLADEAFQLFGMGSEYRTFREIGERMAMIG